MTDSPAAPTAVFPPAGREEWTALVRAESKGRDPRGKATRAGLPRQVVYGPEDALDGDPQRRGRHRGDALPAARPWVAIQRHADADLDRLSQALREDVDGGVDGLWVDLRASGANSGAWLDKAFRGVDVAALRYLGLDGCSDAHGRLKTVLKWLEDRDLSRVTLSVRADPLRTLATDGVVPGDLQLALDRVQRAVDLAERLPAARPVTLTAEPVTRAGGHAVHALGWLLANGAWVLRGLDLRKRAVADVAPFLELHLPLGRDLFEGIAAVRALRVVWARLLTAYGAPGAAPAFIHADAAAGGATRFDPWVNMLRSTGHTFAAIVGGADAITVAPFDRPHGIPDRLGRRVARNTHHVLGAEAHLGDVLDPAGGSWYLEQLTDQLARGAWAELQAIESAGGAAEALTSGWLHARLEAAWTERAARVSHRKEPITGVSEFANVGETLPERPAHPRVDTANTDGMRITPLPSRRDAEQFEALREATAGAPPRVYLATIGPRSEWNARALWVRNVFAAAGFEVEEPEGVELEDLDRLIGDVEDSGAVAACVVAADPRHEAAVPALVAGIGALGPLFVAGRPPDDHVPGVTGYVYAGADIGALLADLLTKLGVR